MKKFITVLFLIAIAIVYSAQSFAAERVSNSATLKDTVVAQTGAASEAAFLKKKMAIQRMLNKYDSPLAKSTDAYIDACKKYQLDCYLLPSIAGLESTFGKHVWPNSYNPVGWGGGLIMFNSWEDGIDTVGRGLRENYVNRGAITLYQIGHIYSESPTWAVRVNIFMTELNSIEQDIDQTLNKPNLL